MKLLIAGIFIGFLYRLLCEKYAKLKRDERKKEKRQAVQEYKERKSKQENSASVFMREMRGIQYDL